MVQAFALLLPRVGPKVLVVGDQARTRLGHSFLSVASVTTQPVMERKCSALVSLARCNLHEAHVNAPLPSDSLLL